MAQLKVPKYDLNSLGVITVIFNPVKYKSRYEQYHKFDEHMSRCGVTLLTVECIFDCPIELGLPRQKFEVTRHNDNRHLQLRTPSVLWLKENLINIAVRSLPDSIEYVAWLDADIEFERLDWAHLTIHQLQKYPIVQLFELSSFLGPSGKKQIIRQDYSFAYAIRHNLTVDPRRSSECYVHPGYGWAMRRSTFEAMEGLLDFSVLGCGDVHFAFGLINRIEESIPETMHEDYRYLARVWGDNLARLCNNGDQVGYVPVNIWHHWHGHRVNRGYFERWSILEQFQFSPLRDLEKNNETGIIRFKNPLRVTDPDKKTRLEEFERTIVSYFRTRNEDNTKRAVPNIKSKTDAARSMLHKKDSMKISATPTNKMPDQLMYRDPRQETEQTHSMRWSTPYRDIPINETSSLSFDLQNDSFFNSTINNLEANRYSRQNYPMQTIYYQDDFGNYHLTSPGEISF